MPYTEIPEAILLANSEVPKPIIRKVGQDGKFSLDFAEKRIVTLEDMNQDLLDNNQGRALQEPELTNKSSLNDILK